ncbi:hypothetical protein, partial [Rhodoferax sp.]|uniref:hypothetical protein n=1 Tax=Rhodoferax sp. TaxID=50421 RepID=UPI0027523FD3|nr:hypothetical protein [Rhodoferax sp.]
LALAAVEVVGLAVVPGLPPFIASVDQKARHAERKARRERLLSEVRMHGGSNHLRAYEQMSQRVESLYRMASDTATSLSEREVEQLDDLTVNYLAMCLGDAAMRAKVGADDGGVTERKLRALTQRLAQGGLAPDDEQQLLRAKQEYEEALARQQRMDIRRSALEASLVSMPVRMEEVYQMVMTAPSAGKLSALLEESMSKLRTAEEVNFDVEAAFGIKSAMDLGATYAEPPVAPLRQDRVTPIAAGRRTAGSVGTGGPRE